MREELEKIINKLSAEELRLLYIVALELSRDKEKE